MKMQRSGTAYRRPSARLVILFFVSGLLALVYEIIWIRKLSLVLGSTTIALSTVMAVFFGGLALGSFVFGTWADSSRSPIRLYAAQEIGIGLWALAFPSLLRIADDGYRLLYPYVSSSMMTLAMFRLAFVAALLIVPTALMGGTLPVLVKHFVRSHVHLSSRVGGLYGVNTFGAALGALLCGFYSIRLIGVDATNYLAAGANVAVGALAWAIAGRQLESGGEAVSETTKPSTPVEPAAETTGFSAKLVVFAVIGFGVSGLTALAYEVVWTRYLMLFLVNSVYTYSTILAVFLLGIVTGALGVARLCDRRRNLVAIFGLAQIGIGLTSLLLLLVFPKAQPLVFGQISNLWFSQFVPCLVLMLVPASFMGATLPLVSRIVAPRLGRMASALGTVYAVNTIGAILGSLLAGYVFLPEIGIAGSIRLLAAINVALGLAALWIEPAISSARRVAAFAATGVIFVWSQLALDEVLDIRLRQIAGGAENIVAVEEGLVATAWVSEDRFGRKALWTNTSVMGRTGRAYRRELSAQRVQGHVPMLLHPGEPRRVLGIGFGTGQTFGAQLLYPIERLDIVDISSEVVTLGTRYFGEHQSGLGSDPRAHIVIDDGRSFVERATGTYDVVTLEMPPHEEAGIVHFYTRDFYQRLRSRLRDDGLIAQWMPIYNVTPTEATGIARTFISVFPEATLWFNGTNILLLGYKDEVSIDVDLVRRRQQRATIFADLAVSYTGVKNLTLNRTDAFLAGFLMGPEELTEFSRPGQIYTDDRPQLEFTWTEFPVWGPTRNDRLVLQNTRAIARHLSEPTRYLTHQKSEPPSSVRLHSIRRSYLNQLTAASYDNLGSYAMAAGYLDQALAHYTTAIQTQPGFSQAYNNLGSLNLRSGRTAEALAAYLHAIRIDPAYAEAYYNIGAAYSRQGRIEDALAAYREAVRAWPEFAAALYAAGRLHAQMRSAHDAEAAYREAIRIDETYAEPYLSLVVLLAEAGRMEEALQALEELLRNVPNEPRAREARDRLLELMDGVETQKRKR